MLSQRELGTVLAALRYWQVGHMDSAMPRFQLIASDDGTIEKLTVEEIDTLCERLNSEPVQQLHEATASVFVG